MNHRNQQSYRGLSRLVISNRRLSDIDRSSPKMLREPSRINALKDFLHEKAPKWIWHSLAHLFGSKHEFVTYDSDSNGIHRLHSAESKNEIRIGLLADWANNTSESRYMAECMMSHRPDYTIHLGDTYYTADENEIDDNFLRQNAPWKRGRCGSFALMGNHEMYSMAHAYYDDLLPTLGPADNPDGPLKGQHASYFCLQTDYWLVIGLDTGYNSVGFPFVWNSFRNNCQLPDPLIRWLKEVVRVGDDPRGIVFLSHHQYASGFKKEKQYDHVGEQLGSLLGKDRAVLWLWGHEHRLAFYGRYKCNAGVTAYGRCIGHGGMPIELDKMVVDSGKAKSARLVGYDARLRDTIDQDNTVGHNGYAILKLNNELLTLEYHDEKNLLLEETWSADLTTRQIRGVQVKSHEKNPRFKLVSSNWTDMTT